MALPVYLAMTAAEMAQNQPPSNCAWMACHFSSYGLGLSNSPRTLPEGSLLILNDRIPVQGHSPDMIAEQLKELAERFCISGVLLDFQWKENSQTAAIARAVTQALDCPVAVTESYAEDLSCAVFLEAPRPYHPLSRQVQKWNGRELWLEAAMNGGAVTVTDSGSRYCPEWAFPEDIPVHTDEKLCCRYTIEKQDDRIIFSFRRTADDLRSLLAQAERLGITRAIGLYQELGEAFSQK